MPDLSSISLVILAGGQSSRMGAPKTHLQIAGRYMLDHLLHQLAWPGPTLLVTSPNHQKPPGFDLFTAEVTDAVPNQGPLRGLLTALENAPTPLVAVAAVDMPHISQEQFHFLAANLLPQPTALGAMLSHPSANQNSSIEPFPSLWRTTVSQLISQELAASRRSIYPLAHHSQILLLPAPNWPEQIWLNLNTPHDAARAQAAFPK